MKKKLWILIAVVSVLIAIFGLDTVVGYIRGGRETVKDLVSEHTTTKMDVARIEALIKSEAVKIGEFSDEIMGLEEKIAAERNKVGRIEKEIDTHKEGLAKARELINEDKGTYFVDGRKRSITEIEADAARRVKYLKSLEGQLEVSNGLIDTLSVTANTCRDNLTLATQNILSRQLDLEKMKAREMNAQIQAKAVALSNSLMGIGDSILEQSELQEAMDTYGAKIAKMERIGGNVPQVDAPLIDYTSEDEKAPDLMEQIDSVLGTKKVAKAEIPSMGE